MRKRRFNSAWRESLRRICRIAAVLVLYSLVDSQPALARHRHDYSSTEPGVFSYYVLSLSWSPAFCLESPNADECTGSRRYGFIVHGLWPQNDRGSAPYASARYDSPQHCNVHREVPEAAVRSMAELMPSRRLVYHEWSQHGTCTGLEPTDYFALVRRAYASITIPPLAGPGHPIEQSTEAITQAFLHSNPRLPPDAIAATCSGQSAPRLREVRLCLSPDLTPRACAPDVLRSACRSSTLIVPPIR